MAASSSSSTQVGLAKTVLDLTASVLNASNSSNPLIQVAIETGQWLGREKLNRFELGDCLSKAKGIAYPNEAGLEFCEKVKEAGLQNPVKHVFLQQSGSLGRLMVRDFWLCWIVSTSASLFQFHSASSFVSDAVCTFIMLGNHPQEEMRHDSDLRYKPDRVQVKSVVDKIVSSIWLNVVNAGHTTIHLPEELKKICPRGHLLSSSNLGLAMHALHQGGRRMILRSQHFLANIALWLVLHHDGKLRVVVSSKTVYDKQQGPSDKEIEIRVERFCSLEGPCSEEDAILGYEILEDLGGRHQHFRSGTYDPTSELHPVPGVRQPLYEIPRLYPPDSRVSKRSIQLLIKATAQRMARWLIQVPLMTQVEFSNFGFQADPDHRSGQSNLTISDILSKTPNIVNLRWGEAASSTVVYTSAEDVEGDGNDAQNSVANMSNFDIGLEKERALEEVLPYFPILQDLLNEVKTSCLCPRCQSDDESMENLLQPGCLRRIAYIEVVLLLAHSIADSFGCEDVSATREVDPIVESVVVILIELCEGRKIIWDTWFSAAACVYLGCPFKHHTMDIESGGTTYGAIQYGNLSVIAPWLDLTAELKIQHCFGLIQGKGTIGVIRTRDIDQDSFQFRGVEETFAIIQTEHTEDTSNYVDRYKMEALPSGSNAHLMNDKADVACDMFLVSAAESTYRFLFRVRSDSHSRVVDPSDAIIRIARSIPCYSCKHKGNPNARQGDLQQNTYLYSFDDVLGRWSNIEGFYGLNKVGPPMLTLNVDEHMSDETDPEGVDEAIHLSHVLDSHLKVNIALALSVNDAAILNDGSSCLSCVQEQVKAVPLPASQQDIGGDDRVTRTVVNVRSKLAQGSNKPTLKRKAIEA